MHEEVSQKIKRHVSYVTDMANSSRFCNETFCRIMEKEHRLLQQLFTDLCVKWLETCAKDTYRYDSRNERSHIIAKKMLRKED